MATVLKSAWIEDWKKQGYLIGSDPEAQLFDTNGDLLEASGYLPTNGNAQLGTDGDATLAELRPTATVDADSHIKNIRDLLYEMQSKLAQYDTIGKVIAKPYNQNLGIGGHFLVDVPKHIKAIDSLEGFGLNLQYALSPMVFAIEGKAGYERRQRSSYGTPNDVRNNSRTKMYFCLECRGTCDRDGIRTTFDGDGQIINEVHCECVCHKGITKTIVELRMMGSWLYDLSLAHALFNSISELSMLPVKSTSYGAIESYPLRDLATDVQKIKVMVDSYNSIGHRGRFATFEENLQFCKEGLPLVLKFAQKNDMNNLESLCKKAMDYKSKTYNVIVFRDHIEKQNINKLAFAERDFKITSCANTLRKIIEANKVWLKSPIHLYGRIDSSEDYKTKLMSTRWEGKVYYIALSRYKRDKAVTDLALIDMMQSVFDHLKSEGLLKAKRMPPQSQTPIIVQDHDTDMSQEDLEELEDV